MSISSPPRKRARPSSPDEGRDVRASQKGQQTKAAIVDAALGLATHIGLDGLSIGALAEVAQMSKSGVFAHFGSREELQISVIREYHQRFEAEVFYPALQGFEPLCNPSLESLLQGLQLVPPDAQQLIGPMFA